MIKFIMGIDPGTTESAYCIVRNDYTIIDSAKLPNLLILDMIRKIVGDTELVIESLQNYGNIVGQEIFQTAYMIGRIMQQADLGGVTYTLYPRPEYAKAICGVNKITDAIVYQALRLRFGGCNKGEPLYLLKGGTDKRSAFAIAAYHLDLQKYKRR